MKGSVLKATAKHLIISKFFARAPVGEFLSRSYLVPITRYAIAKVSY
jgi:hypothetical protein